MDFGLDRRIHWIQRFIIPLARRRESARSFKGCPDHMGRTVRPRGRILSNQGITTSSSRSLMFFFIRWKLRGQESIRMSVWLVLLLPSTREALVLVATARDAVWKKR